MNRVGTFWVMIIYENICRGLFERHKLVLSSMICFQILRQTKEIHEIESLTGQKIRKLDNIKI